MTPVVSIIIPTIAGRQIELDRCIRSYEATSPLKDQIIVVHDKPSCGVAWNEGADQATGDYIHFTADDLVVHDGWREAALEACEKGNVPSPVLYNERGEMEFCGQWRTDNPDWTPVWFSNVPFLPRAVWDQIGPCLPIHYFSDDYLSWKIQQAGIQTVVRRGYAFTHTWSQTGRIHDMRPDEVIYRQARMNQA